MASFKLPVELSRRTLLKTGLIGASFVAAGSVALALQKPRSREAADKLQVLTAGEAGALDALAERLCPAQGPGAPGARAIGLVPYIDGMLSYADAEAQKGFKLALLMFDNALTGAVFGERARPFSQLSAADQDRVLTGWRHSSVPFRRTLYRGLSMVIMATYWSLPQTWPRIGYAGPPSASGLRAAYADNLVDLDGLRATREI
jgi:Gluconate 2-dehydrogenase subunit 3